MAAPKKSEAKKPAAKKAAAKKPEVKKMIPADVDALSDEQVLAELDKLELAPEEGATPEELRAALKEALADDQVEGTKEESEPVEQADGTEGHWSVYDSEGRYVRTYSSELHGENAEALAGEFAGKIAGSVQEGKQSK